MKMNMRRNHFIQVWQAAPTLKAAAAALGMKVRSVTRQANRLRAEGVSLKGLTDHRFNRHASKREKRPLTSEEQMFMAQNYEFARRMSWRACRSVELPKQLVEDIAEGAAVDALLLTARRSTEPGFVPETAQGLVVVAVRCQVWRHMRRLLGPVRAAPVIVEIAPSPSPCPLQEAISREEQPRQAQENESAAELIGSWPDTSRSRESATKKELVCLRKKARELGLSTAGTTAELRERLAAHYRTKLVLPDLPDEHHRQRGTEHERPVEQEGQVAPDKPSSRISQYLVPSPPPKSQEQIEAERFVYTWYESTTATEVAHRLGRKVRSVTSFAGYLRSVGVPLKKLRTHCGPLVRSALALTPSAN